ncbi:MAG: chromosome segregation protein SMC [Actinomycetia bacterium]|nr:chromosome segregation protein SMC [Actinomycetes bacterium]
MFLKSITLAGFKSFGGRTTLELDPGITVIVGPNGSGKSNIVDAVAWATGGQSTRGLRADRTDELLFCGTAGLPPASRAEVTLVFDNTSGLLPIDRPEISITRRFHRSGESEFEINRNSCRLMDITELLAAAGLRKSRYALLGQGQVDRILNASPTEHRKVLEEASGVGKHLWRREKAVRRLESTRVDLDRIEDVIAEKKRRLRPLRRQAEALERYNRLVQQIRSLRLHLEGARLREIDGRLEAAFRSRALLEKARSDASARREACLAALAGVESAQERLRADSAAGLKQDWEMVSERMRRISEVAALRSRERRLRMQAHRRRLALDDERLALEKDLAEMDVLIETATAEVQESRMTAVRLAGELNRLSELRGADAEAEIGGLLGERAALEAAFDRDGRELQGVESRLAELSTSAKLADAETGEKQPRLAQQEEALGEEEKQMEEAKRALAEKKLDLRAAETRAAEGRNALGEASGRLEAARLSLMLEDPRRRKVVESLTGWAGWVGQMLQVPEDLAVAVEAGLERWADAAAFEGPVALGNAVDRMGEVSATGGPVLMVSARFPGGADSLARTVAASGAKVTPLIDQLDPSDRSALAVRMLGDVVLVEDWQSGWEVVGSHPHLRAVTLRGDLITVRGVSLGGGRRLPDLSAATTRAEQAALASRLLEEKVAALRSAVDGLEKETEGMYSNLDRRRQLVADAQRSLDRSLARRRDIAREGGHLRSRRESLSRANLSMEARLVELRDRIERLQEGATEKKGEAEELAHRIEEASRAKMAAEEQNRSKTMGLTRLGERRRLQQIRLEQVMMEMSQVALLPEDLPADRSEEVADMAARALRLLTDRRGVLEELDRAAKRRGRELAAEAAEARSAMGRADHNERLATGEIEHLIAEISRLEARRQSITEGLYEMDADPEQALEAAAPDCEDPAATLAALVGELERARPINHYAASDLAILDEELSQLCDQRDDIVGSARRLDKVISELEKEATERYMAVFREAARAFEQTFAQVFPGGRGRLRIVDPADPLGSGVEIHARPQGKRVSRLSLLSGGERALGAMAFLFALMKTRPSPFYLLDEMDATLDSANLSRVLEIVRELRSKAQILIITHQPQTAEFAEVLYGVTMPPGGTTQVVSRRMDRADQTAEITEPHARSA